MTAFSGTVRYLLACKTVRPNATFTSGVHKGVHKLEALVAQLRFEWPTAFRVARYYRLADSEAIDWRRKLDDLRKADLRARDGQVQAARLLEGCGFAPRGRCWWTAEDIDDKLLADLETLKLTVRSLDQKGATAQAAAYYANLREVLRTNDPPRLPKPNMDLLKKQMASYLKKRFADVPQELPELFNAVALTTLEAGEDFGRIMRSITGTRPLRQVKLPAPPFPEDVLKALLLKSPKIATRLDFTPSGTAVAVLTPLDPIAALLLMAYEASLGKKQVRSWAVCAWCSSEFIQSRGKNCCNKICKNNWKMSRKRARLRHPD